jgi:peptidoglycan/xylan/chitin deacetylase (PgdA/CDA1 family)
MEVNMNIKLRMKTVRVKLLLASALFVGAVLGLPYLPDNSASALVANPSAAAKISFTFDDGLQSAVTQALPTLSKYGLTGTEYVVTKCVGMATIPNTCHANTDASYMTWAQVKQLQTAGWEIGSHSATHPYLATSDSSDGQPLVLTPAQVTAELTQSKSDLAAQGIVANAFSTPYGDYNRATLAQIAKLYTSHRGFADQNANTWPYNDYLLNDMPVQVGVTVAQVKTKIDTAIANKEWLILTMHDIMPVPSSDPDDYQYATANLDQIAAYVKTKQAAGLINPVTVSQGLVTSDTNLLPNSSFDSGITGGWTTDSATTITKDSLNNGSLPSATNSIKLMTSSSKNAHLFSPKVAVDSDTTYLSKNFLSVSAITRGEVGFYIDEYDGTGNWVSGQYKSGEQTAFVEEYNFTYKPSSAAVKNASLQVIVPINSGITAYLDNTQWFALSTATPPVTTNLVANGTFDNGIANGWTTDTPTVIAKDIGNHGSPANPVNSISLKSSTKNAHLFSPKVAVDPVKNYALTSYLNLQQVSGGGQIGFYVDEYDTAGNWISGQYKTGIGGVSVGDVSFQYKPTSSNVKSASLQIIVTGNSGILAYYDDVRWYVAS